MATSFPSVEQLNKARTEASQFSGGPTYSLTFTVDGKQYSFVPKNIAENGGMTAGDNTYLLPYFTNLNNLKDFGSKAQEVDLSSTGVNKYLQSQGLSEKGYLIPFGSAPFDSTVNALPTETFGGELNGLKVIDGQISYGLSGGHGRRYATTTGEVHDPYIKQNDSFLAGFGSTLLNLGPLGGLLGNLILPGLGTGISIGSSIAQGAGPEDLAKSYIASQLGNQVGAEIGGVEGQIAGGATSGLLSGKTPEQALTGSLVNTGLNQATTATPEYIPESNIGQGTPSSTSNFYAPTAPTGYVTSKDVVQPTGYVAPIAPVAPITPIAPSGNLVNETGQITDFAKNLETNELYKPLGTNEYGGNYVPVLGTQGQAQGSLIGQGTTGVNNMDDFTDTGESVSGNYGNSVDFGGGESVSGYYGNNASQNNPSISSNPSVQSTSNPTINLSNLFGNSGSSASNLSSALNLAASLNSLTGGGLSSLLGIGPGSMSAAEAQRMADPFAPYRANLGQMYSGALQPGTGIDITRMPGYEQYTTGVLNPAMEASKRSAAASGLMYSGRESAALGDIAGRGYYGFMTDYLNRLAQGSGAAQNPAQAAGMGINQNLANQQAFSQGLGGIGQGIAGLYPGSTTNAMGNVPYNPSSIYSSFASPTSQYGYGVGSLLSGTSGIGD